MPKYFLYYYLYHFIAEGLIAFIVLLPITFSYYSTNHYITYVILLLVIAASFYILELMRLPNLFFLIVAGLAIFAFYLVSFPIGLAVIFPSFLLWRYLNIRHYDQEKEDTEPLIHRNHINKANLYIKIALLAAAVTVLYSKQFYAMVYVLLLLLILYIGYIASHIAQMPKVEKSSVNLKVFSLIPALFVLGGLIASFIFEPFRESFKQIWFFLANAVIYLAGAVVALIDLIIPNSLKERKNHQDVISGDRIKREELADILEYQGGIDEAILSFFTILILLGALMVFIYRMMNKRRADVLGRPETATEYTPIQVAREKKEGFFSKLYSWGKKLPCHPVRQLIYNFEKQTIKHDLGRYPFESLVEWLNRLDIDISADIYEKVRYGKLDVTEEEINKLNEQLRKVSFKELKSKLQLEEEVE